MALLIPAAAQNASQCTDPVNGAASTPGAQDPLGSAQPRHRFGDRGRAGAVTSTRRARGLPGRAARRSPPTPGADRQESALRTMHGRGRPPTASPQFGARMAAPCRSAPESHTHRVIPSVLRADKGVSHRTEQRVLSHPVLPWQEADETRRQCHPRRPPPRYTDRARRVPPALDVCRGLLRQPRLGSHHPCGTRPESGR